MQNILALELKRTFRSWIYYTVSILATFGVFAAFFEVFKEDAALLDKLLQNFPREFRAAFGFADVNLAEIEGYLSFLLSYIVLIGAVFGMKLGVSLLSEESRRKTADFLLSKPIRRSQIFTAKLLASLILVTAQNILLFGIGILSIPIILNKTIDPQIFALLTFTTFLVQLFFISVGQLIAVAAQKIKQVMPITLGVVFFFFIIELVNQSLHEEKLNYFTPFSYFKGSSILQDRGYELQFIVLDVAVFVILTGISYWIYQRKDIHAVN